MIDLDILEEKGVSVKKLKSMFDKDRDQITGKARELRDRIRQRIQNGIDENLRTYRTYHALDTSWDVPFRQISQTLLATLSGKDPTDEKVNNIIKEWGLTELVEFQDVIDPKTGKKSKAINYPYFFKITVPLVRAYVTIRWAKITNDLDLTPFFKYEPIKDVPKNRLRTEVITDRVERMSMQYGYYDVMKQAVFQMLHYSFCLQFPVEEWHTEEQLFREGEKSEPKAKVVREGLRYHMPHPTRVFWDKAHRISTFNTDTGCEFASYWRVIRFRDITKNKQFWNTDRVSIGSHDWVREYGNFFVTMQQACQMSFPQTFCDTQDAMALDRERILANGFYTADLQDSAVTITEHFEKLIPSEWGFGDYDYPVWFRFVIASDDTILYCAPLPYCPVIYYGYDAVESRSQNASLSLEIQPFQDQVSNLLSQLLLSTKQNLANVTFIDTDQVDEKDIGKIENWGERVFRSLNFLRYSSRKYRAAQNNRQEAFQSVRFPQLDTTSLVNAIKIVLDILERTLVMSSQEVAQAATHEQTREEVRTISATTSTRLQFTANPVARAMAAWKQQIYNGLMAYGEDECYATVSGEFEKDIKKADLEKMGFTVEETADHIGGNIVVHAKNKTAIGLEEFANNKDGQDRFDNVSEATAISQFMQTILTDPDLKAAIGPDQAIEIMNRISRLAGFPRDFKLRNIHPTGDLNESKPKEQAQQAQEQMMQQVEKTVQQQTAQMGQVITQQIGQQMQQLAQGLGGAIEEVKKAFPPVIQAIKEDKAKNAEQDQAIASIVQAMEVIEKALTQSPQLPPAMPPPPGAEMTQPPPPNAIPIQAAGGPPPNAGPPPAPAGPVF